MNEFNFTTMIPQVALFSFVFWRKLKTPKSYFEINQPLVLYSMGELVHKAAGGWVSKTEKSADVTYGWYLNLHIIMVMATANPTIANTIARLIRFLYFSISKILSIFSFRKRSSSRVRSWP